MRKFFKIFEILKNTKFVFYKPQQKKILIFDKQSLDYFSPLFNIKQVYILNTRKETINIYIIYKMIFDKEKFNYQSYLKKTISLVNPKLVITSVDNNIFFFQLKISFKNICFVSVQGTIHFITGDALEILYQNKIYNKYESDYYFVYSDSYAKEMSQFIKSNYITIGSVRNNLFNISTNYKKKTLCYIPRIPDTLYEYIIHKNMNKIKKKFTVREVKVLEFNLGLTTNLKNYCLSNNINLNIIGANENSETESNFFKKLLGEKNWSFLPHGGSSSSYEKIDKFEIIVNPMSTLGYEAIARGKKVAFFSTDQIVGANFGWPLIKEKKGHFFSNSCEESEIYRIINYLFRLRDEEWKKSISGYEKKLFFYDQIL